jgi:hypothetical protein
VYRENRVIGFGRAISDGVYQAAIYDCAVVPELQGKGIARVIMQNILSKVNHCIVILYASPGKEGFYQKHEFRKIITGMALSLKENQCEAVLQHHSFGNNLKPITVSNRGCICKIHIAIFI